MHTAGIPVLQDCEDLDSLPNSGNLNCEDPKSHNINTSPHILYPTADMAYTTRSVSINHLWGLKPTYLHVSDYIQSKKIMGKWFCPHNFNFAHSISRTHV